MPSIKVLNMTGAEVGSIELSEKIFGAEIRFDRCAKDAKTVYLIRERVNEIIKNANK